MKTLSRQSDTAEILARLRSPRPHSARPAHPVFGPLSDAGWLRLAYLHTHHHLRQLGA